MKAVVTGGAGFIGSHLVDRLVEQGISVFVIDNLSTGSPENLNPRAAFFREDIASERISFIFEAVKPDMVFHHAAQIDVQVSQQMPERDAMVNIVGTINILNACVKSHIKKVVYASSAAVYGNPQYLGIDEQHVVSPISNYGVSKHTPEHYLKLYSELYGLKYTVLRYANVYGPRQGSKGEGGVVSIFLKNIVNGKSLQVFGDGEQTRDFIYVRDVVAANLAALHRGDNAVFNIGTGEPVSVNELVAALNRQTGLKPLVEYGPARPGDILHSYYNNSLARHVLGWEPRYDLYQGLKETLAYYEDLKLRGEVAVTR